MLYSAVTALAFAAAALAQTGGFDAITKPTHDENVPAGSTYKITWDLDPNHSGAITIALLGGATPGTLQVVDTIATHVPGTAGSFDWPVASTLGNLATYGIQITLESDTSIFQWGNPFHIVGGSSTGSSTSTSGAGSTSTGSASHTGSTTVASSGTVASSATHAASTSTSVVVVVSSSSSSSSSAAGSSFVVPTSAVISSTARGNLSTTATGVHTTITSVVTQGTTPTKSSSTSVVTNGVGSLAAGSFALVGGVAMAVLAL